jgi:hypothetical protein
MVDGFPSWLRPLSALNLQSLVYDALVHPELSLTFILCTNMCARQRPGIGLGWAGQLVLWPAPELVISALYGAHLTDDFISDSSRSPGDVPAFSDY